MSPEQRAAIAAALLDTLPAEQVLAQRLEVLTEAATAAGMAEPAAAIWRGLNGLHDSLAQLAAAVAAEEMADQAAPHFEGEGEDRHAILYGSPLGAG